MSKFQVGHIPWNKGLKGVQVGWRKGKKIAYTPHPGQIGKVAGEKSNWWKGDEVGYRGIHLWINKVLGKATHCQNNLLHKAKRFVWANRSGEYKRDISDWMQLCPSCNKLDGVHVPERLKYANTI